MLANGAKLGYKKGSASSYTDLPGLKEIPDLGITPEKVDNTVLSDTGKVYEFGIGDYGDLTFTFKYVNDSADSPFRLLRAMEASKEVDSYQLTYPDGTTASWDAQVSTKISGGGVNGAINLTVAMALQSEITWADPSASGV